MFVVFIYTKCFVAERERNQVIYYRSICFVVVLIEIDGQKDWIDRRVC